MSKITRTRLAFLAACLTGGALLTACNGDDTFKGEPVAVDPTAVVEPAATFTAPTSTLTEPIIGDDTFIETLDVLGVGYSSVPAAIEAGEAVCDLFDIGFGVVDTIEFVSENSGMDDYDSGAFTGASVATYCPEYSADVEGFAAGGVK